MTTDRDALRAAALERVATGPSKTSEVAWYIFPEAPNRWAPNLGQRARRILRGLELEGLVKWDHPYWELPGGYDHLREQETPAAETPDESVSVAIDISALADAIGSPWQLRVSDARELADHLVACSDAWLHLTDVPAGLVPGPLTDAERKRREEAVQGVLRRSPLTPTGIGVSARDIVAMLYDAPGPSDFDAERYRAIICALEEECARHAGEVDGWIRERDSVHQAACVREREQTHLIARLAQDKLELQRQVSQFDRIPRMDTAGAIQATVAIAAGKVWSAEWDADGQEVGGMWVTIPGYPMVLNPPDVDNAQTFPAPGNLRADETPTGPQPPPTAVAGASEDYRPAVVPVSHADLAGIRSVRRRWWHRKPAAPWSMEIQQADMAPTVGPEHRPPERRCPSCGVISGWDAEPVFRHVPGCGEA